MHTYTHKYIHTIYAHIPIYMYMHAQNTNAHYIRTHIIINVHPYIHIHTVVMHHNQFHFAEL